MSLNSTAKRRLTKLIEEMEKLPKSAEEHFDMNMWFDHQGEHELQLGKKVTRIVMRDCGTTACALGWAATMPYFNKLGLFLKHDGSIGKLCYGRKTDCDYEEIEGGRKPLFGITRGQWMELFSSNVFVDTPKEWAKHARKLLREWQ